MLQHCIKSIETLLIPTDVIHLGMREITMKKYVRYLFGIVFLLFILNNFYLRPWVLENELPAFFQIFVFSVPNFIEAILGTIILIGILSQLRMYFDKKNKRFFHLLYSHELLLFIRNISRTNVS